MNASATDIRPTSAGGSNGVRVRPIGEAVGFELDDSASLTDLPGVLATLRAAEAGHVSIRTLDLRHDGDLDDLLGPDDAVLGSCRTDGGGSGGEIVAEAPSWVIRIRRRRTGKAHVEIAAATEAEARRVAVEIGGRARIDASNDRVAVSVWSKGSFGRMRERTTLDLVRLGRPPPQLPRDDRRPHRSPARIGRPVAIDIGRHDLARGSGHWQVERPFGRSPAR